MLFLIYLLIGAGAYLIYWWTQKDDYTGFHLFYTVFSALCWPLILFALAFWAFMDLIVKLLDKGEKIILIKKRKSKTIN